MVFADMHGACDSKRMCKAFRCIINTMCLLYHKFGELMVFADMHGACDSKRMCKAFKMYNKHHVFIIP